jgi:hypothetical protein
MWMSLYRTREDVSHDATKEDSRPLTAFEPPDTAVLARCSYVMNVGGRKSVTRPGGGTTLGGDVA